MMLLFHQKCDTKILRECNIHIINVCIPKEIFAKCIGTWKLIIMMCLRAWFICGQYLINELKESWKTVQRLILLHDSFSFGFYSDFHFQMASYYYKYVFMLPKIKIRSKIHENLCDNEYNKVRFNLNIINKDQQISRLPDAKHTKSQQYLQFFCIKTFSFPFSFFIFLKKHIWVGFKYYYFSYTYLFFSVVKGFACMTSFKFF